MLHDLPSAICDGGPHVFVPWDQVAHWHGAEGGVLPDFTDTDYGRACAVPEPAGLVPVGPGQGLVIAGSPAFTYWVDTPGRAGGDLVAPRAWADFSDSDIRAACRDFGTETFRDLGFIFPNRSHGCCLFAACDNGPEWVYATSWVPLAPGDYRVLAVEAERPSGLQLRVLRLVRDH